MEERVRRHLGKTLYNSWTRRRRFAETQRPRALAALSVLAAVSGLFALMQAVLAARRRPEEGGPVDGTLAVVLLAAGGLSGLGAAPMITARRPAGAYLALLLSSSLGAAGARAVRRREGTCGLTGALLDLSLSAAVALLLGLGWYSLDPLRLHWETD